MAENKIALVTGANKGLGFEMAQQLAEVGVTVVLGARDASRGEAAAASLRGQGLEVRFLRLDVVSADDRAAAAAYLEANFGRLDILINNAGISGQALGQGSGTAAPPEVLHDTFETNFFAPIALTRALLPLLKKSAAGRIVNLSSILGSQALHADPASPIAGAKDMFAYNASKVALNKFTIHLADELKDTAIKVNSAHPGWVKTDMGTDAAPMELPEGAKTGVDLALLGEDGPTGGFFHLGKPLPW